MEMTPAPLPESRATPPSVWVMRGRKTMIGLNTAVFAAVDAMLLRPLAGVRDAESLVQLYRTAPGGEQFNSNSIPHYVDLRDRT